VTRDEPTAQLNDRRMPALDGVRGLAILLVMLLHFTDRTPAGDLANRVYVQIADIGWIGVDLFFVLSGFLITSLLLDAKGAPHYFRDFWARRVLRIFPAYYACLFFWLIIAPLLLQPESVFSRNALAELHQSQAWFWSYLSNWKIGLDGEWTALGTSVYWSLAIEEQFYLVWPVVVLLASPRTLARICIALIVTALLARVSLAAAGAHPILIYTNTFTRMDTLATGALVAVIAHDSRSWASLQRYLGWFFGAALGALGVIWASLGAFAEYHALMQTIGFTALCVLFGALVARAATPGDGRVTRAFSTPVLRFFGKYSYAMYLFHETIAVFVVPRLGFGEVHAIWAQLARVAVLTPLTVIAALLSWHLFEKHFLALKRFFPKTGVPFRPPLRTGSGVA